MNNDRYRVSKIREYTGPRITTTSVDNIKHWLSDESSVSNDETSDEDDTYDKGDDDDS